MQINTTTDNARKLRRQPTKEENKLWQSLRGRRFAAYKFRRQHPIGSYVLDFYCHRLKFAIEIDGLYHEYVAEADERRTIELATCGITIMRITNAEIRDEWDFIEDRILSAISNLPGPSPVASRHPLPEGEG